MQQQAREQEQMKVEAKETFQSARVELACSMPPASENRPPSEGWLAREVREAGWLRC